MQRSALQRQLCLDVFWTQASSAWPLQEARSPGPVSWHVSLPPSAEEECRCPWGKWKHLVLARPVHISAGPHELAGDACTEENRRPQRWPTSFLLHRPQPRNMDEYVLGSENTLVKVTKTALHWGEIQAVPKTFILRDQFHSPPLWYHSAGLFWMIVSSSSVTWVYKKIPLLVNLGVYSVALRSWSS